MLIKFQIFSPWFVEVLFVQNIINHFSNKKQIIKSRIQKIMVKNAEKIKQNLKKNFKKISKGLKISL